MQQSKKRKRDEAGLDQSADLPTAAGSGDTVVPSKDALQQQKPKKAKIAAAEPAGNAAAEQKTVLKQAKKAAPAVPQSASERGRSQQLKRHKREERRKRKKQKEREAAAASAGGGAAAPGESKSAARASSARDTAASDDEEGDADMAEADGESKGGKKDGDAHLADALHSKKRAEKKDKRAAQASLKKAKRLKDVLFYNKLISQFGNDKHLGFALTAFEDMRALLLRPTVYTFTNLINACVRCGETDKALEFLRAMPKAGVQPNEVTYTALIKGLCQDGRIGEALESLQAMRDAEAAPNLRTFNTLLRGCLRAFDADSAERVFAAMAECGVAPDVTSFEYSLRALAQAMRTKEAWTRLTALQEAGFSSALACIALATACALKGDLDSAEKAIKRADKALRQEDEKHPSLVAHRGDDYGDDGYGAGAAAGGGGDGESGGGERASVPLFLRLRRQEAETELERVRAYVAVLRDEEAAGVKQPEFDFGGVGVVDRRTVLFLPNAQYGGELLKPQGLAGAKQPLAVLEGKGAGGSKPKSAGGADAKAAAAAGKGGKSESKQGSAGSAAGDTPAALIIPLGPGARTLRLASLFPKERRSLPIRVEICSGHGEWIVQKAAEDQNSNWVALEIRPERIFLTWAKMRMARCQPAPEAATESKSGKKQKQKQGEETKQQQPTDAFAGLSDGCSGGKPVTNLRMLCGEACAIFGRSLADGSVDEVFINYPDPPVWTGSRQRLIEPALLHELHRVLKDKCPVTVVTDDHAYHLTMVKEFSRLSPTLFAPVPGQISTAPPEGYGSSYFDRMWLNGDRTDRFFLKYTKA